MRWDDGEPITPAEGIWLILSWTAWTAGAVFISWVFITLFLLLPI